VSETVSRRLIEFVKGLNINLVSIFFDFI